MTNITLLDKLIINTLTAFERPINLDKLSCIIGILNREREKASLKYYHYEYRGHKIICPEFMNAVNLLSYPPTSVDKTDPEYSRYKFITKIHFLSQNTTKKRMSVGMAADIKLPINDFDKRIIHTLRSLKFNRASWTAANHIMMDSREESPLSPPQQYKEPDIL